jgi:two-component system, NtrC family, sensor kinase
MKFKIFVILLISCSIKSLGQKDYQIDSLKRLLTHSTEDSVKAKVIIQLVYEYLRNRPDSSIYYANLGLDLVRQESTKERFEKTDDPDLYGFEGIMYSLIGTALAEERNDALAVKMTLKSLELAEKSKDKYDIERAYRGVAEVYQFIGEPAIAIGYLKRKIELDTSEDGRISYGAVLGTCFFDKGDYDSALYYLKRIDPLFKIEGGHLWPYPHLYLGKIYAKKQDYQKALGYFRTAIYYASQYNYSQDYCDAALGISEVYRNLNLVDSAIKYSKSSLQESMDVSLPDRTMEASSFLASVYDLAGQKDSAIKYLKLTAALKDSLHNVDEIKQIQNYTFSEKWRQREIAEQKSEYINRVRYYGLLGGMLALILIALILYRSDKNKQKLNSLLLSQKDEIQSNLLELRTTQAQLIQSEKMASLGELTAGIAHEIQNPLNFVNNFSEVNTELIDETELAINAGKPDEAKDFLADLRNNQIKINHHGKRADAIVKGMLQHSRSSTGTKEPTDVNALTDEYLRLSYHGLRARDKLFNAAMKTDYDQAIGNINIIPQDIGRVLLNLCNNAFYAVSEKEKQQPESYEPTVYVSTYKTGNKVEIRVNDNGNGIPQKIIDKIFQPFFTMKPTGQGTGLGLSMSYDIIKAHGGELKVESKEGEGAEFVVLIPIA